MKAYIQDKELLKRSKHHTVYVGTGAVSSDPRKPNEVYHLVFINGVAEKVDENTFQRFKDAGHCDDSPPTIWTP